MASREFRVAAESQARALGTEISVVLVPHPIQTRTDDEMITMANDVVEAVVCTIAAQPGGSSGSTVEGAL